MINGKPSYAILPYFEVDFAYWPNPNLGYMLLRSFIAKLNVFG